MKRSVSVENLTGQDCIFMHGQSHIYEN